MTLADLTEPRILVPRLLSLNQRGTVMELSKRLENARRIIDYQGFAEAVLQRQEIMSLVLDHGIAIPHARGGAVCDLSLAIGVCPRPIAWGEEGAQVQLICMFAVPLADAQRYLSCLGRLVRFLQDPSNVDELTNCRQPEDILNILKMLEFEPPDPSASE